MKQKNNSIAKIFGKKFDNLDGFGDRKARSRTKNKFETMLELIEEMPFSIESVRLLSDKAQAAAKRIFSNQAASHIEKIKKWQERKEKAHLVASKF